MKNNTVKDLPIYSRPYEKFEKAGPMSLSDAELLAVIIRTGTKDYQCIDLANIILNYDTNKPDINNIMSISIIELIQIKGIGKVKAIQIKAIAELSRRIAKSYAAKKLCCNNSKTVADYYMEDLRHKDKEVIIAMFLNTKSMLINDYVLSMGTVNASLIGTREIFIEALKNKAVFIILIHNHPSGDCTPSRDDIINTKRIIDAGNMIGITLIDHIIIGDNKYVSLKERGII